MARSDDGGGSGRVRRNTLLRTDTATLTHSQAEKSISRPSRPSAGRQTASPHDTLHSPPPPTDTPNTATTLLIITPTIKPPLCHTQHTHRVIYTLHTSPKLYLHSAYLRVTPPPATRPRINRSAAVRPARGSQSTQHDLLGP